MRKVKGATDKILEGVLEGIQRIKGKEIIIIDLNSIHHTECGFFVICHGTCPVGGGNRERNDRNGCMAQGWIQKFNLDSARLWRCDGACFS